MLSSGNCYLVTACVSKANIHIAPDPELFNSEHLIRAHIKMEGAYNRFRGVSKCTCSHTSEALQQQAHTGSRYGARVHVAVHDTHGVGKGGVQNSNPRGLEPKGLPESNELILA